MTVASMTMPFQDALNAAFDRLIRPHVHLGRWEIPAFQLFGLLGIVLGTTATIASAAARGLSLPIAALLVVFALSAALALALLTKIVTGQERLVYYHHQLAILITTTLALLALGQPVLAYLDLVALGLGVFTVAGRLGCLCAGCCHGRPSNWGIRYRREHALTGFPHYLLAIRLVPVQALESLWALVLVSVGMSLLALAAAPGAIWAWYVIGYASGRVLLEFLRGDPVRPYLAGLSGAQWTSLLWIAGVVIADISGLVSFPGWQIALVVAALVATVTLWLRSYRLQTSGGAALYPSQVSEIADVLERLSRPSGHVMASQPDGVQVISTPSGLRISRSQQPQPGGIVYHYAFSGRTECLSVRSAERLASLVVQLRHPSLPHQLITGASNVFHLLVFETTASSDVGTSR